MSPELLGLILSPIVVGGLVVYNARRERSARRSAVELGALWGGSADLWDARRQQSVAEVARALDGVGAMYGESLSVYRQRPVLGELLIYADRICWRPRLYTGRGKAAPWELRTDQLSGWSLERPRWMLRGWNLTLHARTGGTVVMSVVDRDRLTRALEVAVGPPAMQTST